MSERGGQGRAGLGAEAERQRAGAAGAEGFWMDALRVDVVVGRRSASDARWRHAMRNAAVPSVHTLRGCAVRLTPVRTLRDRSLLDAAAEVHFVLPRPLRARSGRHASRTCCLSGCVLLCTGTCILFVCATGLSVI